MTRHIPDTLPFEVEEFMTRYNKVREEMARRGIDVLYVTSPANILYLTGYDAIWYPWRLPLGVVITTNPNQGLVFFDWTRHEHYVRLKAMFDETEFFEYHDMKSTTVSAFRRRGWLEGRVAFEWYSPNPAAPVIKAVADSVAEAGAEVVSGDWVIDNVRLYKSPAELLKIRRAAAMADAAFIQLQADLVPGMTEMEVSAHLTALLAAQGSEHAATPPLVSSGPTAWCDVHSFPSHRKLEKGDTVSIDCCAVVDRYHANLARTFALGEANSRARAILQLSADSVVELQQRARLGEGPEIAAAAAEKYIRDRIPGRQIWWVGGYALGLAFPPSWVGHTYLANDGLEGCSWQPGYVSNYETVFYDDTEGFEAQNIDTIVMTEEGLEVLSVLPRTMLQVPV